MVWCLASGAQSPDRYLTGPLWVSSGLIWIPYKFWIYIYWLNWEYAMPMVHLKIGETGHERHICSPNYLYVLFCVLECRNWQSPVKDLWHFGFMESIEIWYKCSPPYNMVSHLVIRELKFYDKKVCMVFALKRMQMGLNLVPQYLYKASPLKSSCWFSNRNWILCDMTLQKRLEIFGKPCIIV